MRRDVSTRHWRIVAIGAVRKDPHRLLEDSFKDNELVPCHSSVLPRVCDLEEYCELVSRDLLEITGGCYSIDKGLLVKVSAFR